MGDTPSTMEYLPDILTPSQAAAYLQVDRETIYRYIRQGKLVASHLGRAYRMPRASLDRFLVATRTRQDIVLREYTGAEIATFLQDDQLEEAEHAVVVRWGKRRPDRPGT